MSTQEKVVLDVSSRDSSGKGVARKLRVEGLVPAVCYGLNTEARKLQVPVESIVSLFDNPKRYNVLFDLRIDEDTVIEDVMVKSYQLSPVRRDLLHVDFYVVDLKQPIHARVPIQSTGRAQGVRMGGILNVIRPEIDIKARPLDIPVSVSVDVTSLRAGETILANDVELPEGVEPGYKSNYGLFRVVMPRKRAAANAEAEK